MHVQHRKDTILPLMFIKEVKSSLTMKSPSVKSIYGGKPYKLQSFHISQGAMVGAPRLVVERRGSEAEGYYQMGNAENDQVVQ